MSKDGNNKGFWNLYAGVYDFEIKQFNKSAYAEMYRRMSLALNKTMNVLEVATGTGLIAINIAPYVHFVEATDFSPKMIQTAKKKKAPGNVRFTVEDATSLSFNDNTFDAVIISNALHIMPNPSIALENIYRVLKPNGILIAPVFSHGHLNKKTWNINAKFLKLIGFQTYSKWTPEEYVAFINQNQFIVSDWQALKAGFPLVYLEARSN